MRLRQRNAVLQAHFVRGSRSMPLTGVTATPATRTGIGALIGSPSPREAERDMAEREVGLSGGSVGPEQIWRFDPPSSRLPALVVCPPSATTSSLRLDPQRRRVEVVDVLD